MTITLGISAFYHDSAATLVVDGKIVAAAQEERFSRIRHDPGFPRKAIEYVLRNAGINLADVDHVAYYEDPALKFRRVLSTAAVAGLSAARTYAPVLGEWLSTKRRMDREVVRHLRAMGDRDGRRIEVHGHHESHAASAFFPVLSRAPRSCVSTVSASGRRPPSGTAGQKVSSWLPSCPFPIRWACFIRPSPISAASRWTPANTNSWDLRHMASLITSTRSSRI